jgi:hypothetical protein
MYELVVIACLIGHPADCEEFYVPFQRPMGFVQCIYQAQLRLASWAAERPDWTIRRWTCALPPS